MFFVRSSCNSSFDSLSIWPFGLLPSSFRAVLSSVGTDGAPFCLAEEFLSNSMDFPDYSNCVLYILIYMPACVCEVAVSIAGAISIVPAMCIVCMVLT